MKKWELYIVIFMSWIFAGLIGVYYFVIHYQDKHHSDLQHRMPLPSPRSSYSFSSSLIDTAAWTNRLDQRFHLNLSNHITLDHPSLKNQSVDTTYQNQNVNRKSSNSSQYKRIVVFDWHMDSDYVSYLNYKSIESFLACCYTKDTYIELSILGPNKANYYKVSKLLSKHTFSKYIKKGYNFKPYIHSDTMTLFSSTSRKRSSRQMNVSLGAQYLAEEFQICCAAVLAKKGTTIEEMPVHAWFFARIARLFTQGGEFYDFTWFHQSKLSDIINEPMNQGIRIESYCYDQNTSKILPNPPNSIESLAISIADSVHNSNLNHYWTLNRDKSTAKCSSSTIMYFPEPNNPVLGCLLLEYDSRSSILMQCLRSPVLTKLSKDIRPYYDNLCLKEAFQRCFQIYTISNDLEFTSTINIISSDQLLYRQTTSTSNIANTAILWLGIESILGEWISPFSGSYLYQQIENNNNLIQSHMNKYAMESSRNITMNTTCSHYAVFDEYQNKFRKQASLSCSLTFVLPGFMKAGTSYLFDMMSKHPQILLTLKGVIFKETGCYYGEILSTPERSQERMNCFPYVESHDGLIYGDGTVYYIHRFQTAEFLRLENPNIKTIILIRDPIQRSCSHHRFSYGQFILNKYPNFNDVVAYAFTPNQRLDQLYHFAIAALEEYKTTDLNNGSSNSNSGHPIHKNSSMAILIDNFRRPAKVKMTREYERCFNVFYPSLYFPFIYIWDQIMGKENILVIEGERITPSRSKNVIENTMSEIKHVTIPYTGYTMTRSLEDEINDVFRFIGLNPLENVPKSFEHKTRSFVIPEHEMNETTKKRMEEFYAPFNELLSLYLKRRRSNQMLQ